MKYAKEVIDLMAAYPGREFRMADLIRHSTRARQLTTGERNAARMAVLRVIGHLNESGHVERHEQARNSYFYSWRSTVQHAHQHKCYSGCNNTAEASRL